MTKLIEILVMSIGSLGANKLRSILTLIGMVIGVASVITLMSIGRGAQAQITSRVQSLGTNLLFITAQNNVAGGKALTFEDSIALSNSQNISTIVGVAPELMVGNQTIEFSRDNVRTSVRGVTFDYSALRNESIELGNFINNSHVRNRSNVAVLGSDTAEDLFGFRVPIDEKIRINGREFTVIGVLKSKGSTGFGNQDDKVLIPITTAYYRLSRQKTATGEVAVSVINVQAKSVEVMDKAISEIGTVLRLRHKITGEDDFSINNQQETLDLLEQATNTFVVFLGAIASISLLVGGIGIMNIMLVSVTERTREIGIRKAMGAKKLDILLQFLFEATFLSLGGGLFGVLTGMLLSSLFNNLQLGSQTLHTVVSGDIAFLALLVSAGIGMFFGIYPAFIAAKLNPIEALRYE
tara:strand:- start:2413 stop:3639 length:1227 start_codon:yes stop_codon:yes gene_type:complete